MHPILPLVRSDAVATLPRLNSHGFRRHGQLARRTTAEGLHICTVLALACIFLFGSACVAPNARKSGPVALNSTGQNNNKSDDVVCEYERPTGSNIPKRVCRSLRDTESDRQEIQDSLRRMPKSEPWSKD